jgi:hypothetical protein
MSWRDATFVVWGVLGVGLILCQLAALCLHGRLPGAGALLRTLVSNGPVRMALLLGWAWLGWHAFAR